MYASIPIPDARRTEPGTYREECASLLRIIRTNCPAPDGKQPTMGQVADLLGCGDTALYDYCTDKPRPGRRGVVPFSVLYCLRAMVACLPATQRALWGTHAG